FGRRGLVEERDQPRAGQPARVVRRGGAGGGRHGGADVRTRDRAGPVAGRLRFGGRDGGGHGGDHGRRGGGRLDAAGRLPAPGGRRRERPAHQRRTRVRRVWRPWRL